jgi:uncharacterized RDD family membrane protein YckC
MADNPPPSEPRYAGFWLRLGASVIDVIVLLAIIAPIEIAVYGRGYPALAMQGKTLAVDVWTQLALPLLAMIVLWRYRSATLTLRAVALLVMWLLVVPLIGVIWIAFDMRKQGWHDKLAKTVVIRNTDD